jgi:large subunit ribosomal protein L7/L12
MTLIKTDTAPTLKKIRQARPYLTGAGRMFGFYSVMVTWADGTRKKFDSKEAARAYVEQRRFDESKLASEIPSGFNAIAASKATTHPCKQLEDVVSNKTEFDVIITAQGDKKIQVIKAIRELTGLGLKESKEMITNLPSTIKEGIAKDDAEFVKQQLTNAGATVEVR